MAAVHDHLTTKEDCKELRDERDKRFTDHVESEVRLSKKGGWMKPTLLTCLFVMFWAVVGATIRFTMQDAEQDHSIRDLKTDVTELQEVHVEQHEMLKAIHDKVVND